jgi:hypothetical protein
MTDTTLWDTLGLQPGGTLALVGTPDAFVTPELPAGARLLERASEPLDVTVFFTSREATLRGRMPLLAPWVAEGGSLWIAWPREGSGRETDLSPELIASVGAPAGLAAGEVAVVDGTWQGLRLSR